MDTYIAAVVGFVTAAVLAMLNNWLQGRQKVAEGVRAQRIAAYPTAWRRTGIVSRWPRTDAGREHVLRLHEDLRRWYYAEGGIYLSTRARKRYEHLQLVLEAILSRPEWDDPRHYEAAMEAASYFRTSLTNDLDTREQRGWVATVLSRLEESRARRRADARLQAIRDAPPVTSDTHTTPGESRPLHHLTPEDERLKRRRGASTAGRLEGSCCGG